MWNPASGGFCLGGARAQESFSSGQNIAPVYEGWEQNTDGSFNLVFGYMNRNWEEEIDRAPRRRQLPRAWPARSRPADPLSAEAEPIHLQDSCSPGLRAAGDRVDADESRQDGTSVRDAQARLLHRRQRDHVEQRRRGAGRYRFEPQREQAADVEGGRREDADASRSGNRSPLSPPRSTMASRECERCRG